MTKKAAMLIVPFRLPADLVKRLDRHALRLRQEHPGIEITRADAVRSLLVEALAAKEGATHGKT